MLAAGITAQPAFADTLPSGASIAAGSAQVDAGSSSVTVNQSSARAVINWTGFSVGAGNNVVFNQPDAQSATLNRVTGSASSTIAGQISSNGAVYLVNTNGIAITPSGAVDTRGGFVASTLDIADGDFMSGNLAFTGNGASAGVANAGTIRAGENAFVALLGGAVSNSGTIAVPLGKVGLGSGERIALDLNGGNFLQVSVPTALITGSGALIDSSGTITASGGTVRLLAATVKDAVRNVINMTGAISADSAVADGGTIKLLGGDGGLVTVSGTLTARGGGPVANGGLVETSGQAVDLNGIRVDTTAANGKTGQWVIDPSQAAHDFTIAPTGGDISGADLSANLQTNAVFINSNDGIAGSSGDINFNDTVSWTSGNSLFVSATHSINFSQTLTATNGAFIELKADQTGSGSGTVSFSNSAKVLTNGSIINIFYNPTSYTTPTDFSGDVLTTSGSVLFPYMLVNNVNDLQAINTNLSGYYAQNITIDASSTAGWNSGAGFQQLGTDVNGNALNNNAGYTGVYYSQGLAITGLTINRPNTTNVGLFGFSSGTIRADLTGASITGGSNTGGVAGTLSTAQNGVCLICGTNAVNASNFTGSVSGINNVGGLVGTSTGNINGGTVSNSTITGRVATDGSGGNGVGGILGTQTAGTVQNTVTVNDVAVVGAPNVGGVVGALGAGTIHNAVTGATVTGTNGTGGAVGSAFGGTITASTATGVVNGQGNAGGFIGVIAGAATIDGSFGFSVTNATGYAVGGFVGAMNGGGTITNSAAGGNVTGYAFVGGFAGAINPDAVIGIGGSITGSLVSGGTITATSTDANVDNPVGGFAGFAGGAALSNDTVISTTNGIVRVNGFNDVGGFIGLANQGSALTSVTSDATVSATNNNVGGIAGALIDGSTLDLGTATGSVSSPNGVTIGGLVGYLTGTVSHGTATGAVTGLGFVGGLVGNINGGGTVSNSLAGGVVTGSDPVNSDKIGGLVGHSQDGTISESITTASSRVSGGTNIGGIIGQAESGTALNGVVSNSIVIGQGSVGGIAGQLLRGSTIGGGTANGSVTGTGIAVGGAVGYIAGGSITNTVSFAPVSGLAYVGGLVGNINGGTVSNSSTGGTATVTGNDLENSYWIGGLVGNASAATIVDSSASGAVRGNAQIGGLVGYLNTDSSISGSGATGSVTGTGSTNANFDIGGLVGFSAGSISQSTASGEVRGFLYVGGLVGWLDDAGTIFGSRADGTVTGVAVPGATGIATTGTNSGRPFQFDHTYDIGGLVGLARGYIDAGDQSGSVSAGADSENVGGLAGEAAHLITRSQSRAASVIGGLSVGGLVGTVDNVTIDGSTARAMVSGNTNVGGLVGTSDGTISNSNASGAVSGSNSVGGLLGSGTNGSLVTRSVATGNVTLGVGTGAGGLVGYDYGTISLSYATGNVFGGSGSNSLGGLVGVLNGAQGAGTASDVYATGAVTGQNIVGGLVGGNTGSINRTYAVGAVSGSTRVGGIVGWNLGSTSSVTNSYWDTLTTASPAGFGQNDGTFIGAGRTTAQMQDLNTFRTNYGGFDFSNVWAPPNQSGQGGDATAHYPELYALSRVLWIRPDDASRVYGNANPALTFSVFGSQNGGVLNSSPQLSSVANATSGVGSYAVTQTGATSNYRVVLSNGTLTVTPRPLTLTPDALSRLYGGSNPANDTASAAVATANSGLVNGDSVATVSVAGPAIATSGVGQYALSGSNAVFSQGSASNYTITYNTNATGLTINPAPLLVTYTANAASRLYGQSNPPLTGSVAASGLLNNETLNGVTSGTATFTSTATATSNVGQYAILGSGLSPSSSNYSFSFAQAPGNATGLTITPAQLSTVVTASLVGSASKTYDGTRIATLTPANFLLAGFASGEGATVTRTTGAYATANAGNGILVTATLAAGDYQASSGTNLGNYLLPTRAAGTIGTILPASLSITYLANTIRRSYGQSNPLLSGTAIASGLVGGDSLATVTTGSATFSSSASRTSNVGTYAITGSGLAGNNSNYTYIFVQAPANFSSLSVTPASLIVYYTANPVTTRAGQAAGPLTGSQLAIGLVNGDTLASVTTGTAMYTSSASTSSGAGLYAINGSGLVAANANYAIRFLQSPMNSFAYSVLPALRTRSLPF
ncbi:MBG domain-containing protein [Novosphingobium sp.]|uniref:MBG domain-containing protein n=1 Tax=Novosphingobium sp. TaxID=1874826 RepID=UPI0025E871DC|nr:MBG domain-containing protein [Novosphingobium sp.]